MKSYVTFCKQHSLLAVPADVDTLPYNLVHLAAEKLRPAVGASQKKTRVSNRSPSHMCWLQSSSTWLPSARLTSFVMDGIARTLRKRQ
ncbi:hypothetical protein MON38_20915 [Hymenobacter sp. DH14]|uniref:Uncharacterized protein n=1 Tax=Hymenobacter cyanobacteriorum TaxID=2926463 RepID=A0A9X2AHJ4_9BACT|nr:hypothetical protein [Hymenobacter cyanobacteriorum]MCI1189892.1 hypothetical protein [Hymenobacter cyanobacteriorum]